MKIYLQLTGSNNHISSFHIKETVNHTIEHDIEESFLQEFKNKMGNYYYVNNEIVFINLEEKRKKVSQLKLNLLNTDYKIIKCSEAQLANEQMPYNIQELLTQRKAWREEINALEFELSILGN
jgi:translation initiation factor 6 (eIF-6)